MAATGRRCKAIVEPVCALRETKSAERRAGRLVEHVHAVTPAVAAGNARGLTVQTHAEISEVAKLTHSSLRATERVHAHTHRYSAVHTAMDVGTPRGKPGRLEREYLV